ncbi:MAG: PEP-CTERM sorting domain-containing protein [Planctomycetales bacterium]|nr:PEP-CTERM sorting domain-containing protein [Planctomycetales bacterium]
MLGFARYRRAAIVMIAALLVSALGVSAHASPLLTIQLGGVDIAYDGTNIYNGGPDAGDPLTTVAFVVDGSMVGSVLTSEIALDVLIPDVTNIPDTGGMVSSAAGGTFDLLLPGGDFLALDMGSAMITYVNISNVVEFVFAGSIATVDGQALPYGLEIGESVTISFSTPINDGSLVTSGGTVDAFTATGTGEVRGTLIPEPATLSLTLLSSLALLGACRRR